MSSQSNYPFSLRKRRTSAYFRPYLTIEHLDAFCEHFSKHFNAGEQMSAELMDGWRKLTELRISAGAGEIKPALETSGPRKISTNDLGLAEEQNYLDQDISAPVTVTPQQRRAAAWAKHQTTPQLCTEHDMELVESYKAEHGLISAEEVNKKYMDMILNSTLTKGNPDEPI